MNTRLLMRTSAIFMGLMGIVASFLPQEILAHMGGDQSRASALIIQTAGAMYLGFGALNWTAQANLIGGIYSRPVSLANFAHFTIASLALLKGVAAGEREVVALCGCAAYSMFAVSFGFVVFLPPRNLGKGGAR